MSGPKGSSYQVVSAEELERRRVVEIRARCDVLAKRAYDLYIVCGNAESARNILELRPLDQTSNTYMQFERN